MISTSLPLRPLKRSSRPRAIAASLLNLPTEVLAEILSQVSFPDLCAFRQLCNRSARLIERGEIVRRWISVFGNMNDRLHLLYRPPSPPTFHYVLEQHRRLHVATNLATLIAVYVEKRILHSTIRRFDVFPHEGRANLLEKVKAQMRDRMMPLILTFQHYLERFAKLVLDISASLDLDPNADWHFHALERQLFDGYELEHLLLVHKFVLFLCWLHNQIMDRVSYGGASEHIEERQVIAGTGHFDYQLFLVLANVSGLRDLMMLQSSFERRNIVKRFVRDLDPDLNPQWQQRWREVPSSSNEAPTEQQVKEVVALKLSARDVWLDSAKDHLIENGVLSKEVRGLKIGFGLPWQAMDFLCEIAPYDVLRNPPSIMHFM